MITMPMAGPLTDLLVLAFHQAMTVPVRHSLLPRPSAADRQGGCRPAAFTRAIKRTRVTTPRRKGNVVEGTHARRSS